MTAGASGSARLGWLGRGGGVLGSAASLSLLGLVTLLGSRPYRLLASGAFREQADVGLIGTSFSMAIDPAGSTRCRVDLGGVVPSSRKRTFGPGRISTSTVSPSTTFTTTPVLRTSRSGFAGGGRVDCSGLFALVYTGTGSDSHAAEASTGGANDILPSTCPHQHRN